MGRAADKLAGIRSEAGFSLLESMMVCAMFFAVVLASLEVILYTNTFMSRQTKQSNLVNEIDGIVNYIKRQVMSAGGGLIPARAAVFVENNCAARAPLPNCQGTDRLTLMTLDVETPECAVTAYMTGSNTVTLGKITRTVAGTQAEVCCLQTLPPNRQLLLYHDPFFRQVYAQSLDPIACTLTFVAGQVAANDYTSNTSGTISSWAGATLMSVNIRTYYLEHAKRQLRTFTDRNNNAQIDAGEVKVIGGDMHDFQATAGYDFAPLDGTISDAQSTGDEWQYNAFGSENFGSVDRDLLRGVGVGVTVGESGVGAGSAGGGPQTAQIFDGPRLSRRDWLLRSGRSMSTFRDR